MELRAHIHHKHVHTVQIDGVLAADKIRHIVSHGGSVIAENFLLHCMNINATFLYYLI